MGIIETMRGGDCMRHFFSLPVIIAFFFQSSCGAKRVHDESEASMTRVEQAFTNAAQTSGVPVRLLLASAFVESGLRAEQSSAMYQSDGQPVGKTTARGESAVGFSFAELGLQNDAGLIDQITAYGELLKSKLSGLNLSSTAVTTEEKMRWIWALSKVHRGQNAQQNLLSVFSQELIRTLNQGFLVQDRDGMVAHLEREVAPLREEDLPENYRRDLQLDMYHADIRSAHLFSLVRSNPNEGTNTPSSIEVVHCPFTLSACIELQYSQASDMAPLGAHYIVPASDNEVPGTLQFAHHDEVVSLISSDGSIERVNNRIVIMLAGLSGRYKEGRRVYADPLWMTDFQLRALGAAVNEICSAISRSNGVNIDECRSVGGAKGVYFRSQKGETFHWGDVADFDETIFGPYLQVSDNISANTTITVAPDGVQQAGSSFQLTAGFQVTTRRVEIERLVRCSSSDQRVVWEPVDQRQVRNITRHSFDNVWYDAGPNGTGDQFFRVKATGDGGRFMGWSTKKVQMRGFEKDMVPEAPSKYCLRNGT